MGIGFFSRDILLLFDDMQALKPSVFPTVPRLLNKIRDKVNMSKLFCAFTHSDINTHLQYSLTHTYMFILTHTHAHVKSFSIILSRTIAKVKHSDWMNKGMNEGRKEWINESMTMKWLLIYCLLSGLKAIYSTYHSLTNGLPTWVEQSKDTVIHGQLPLFSSSRFYTDRDTI